MIAHPSATTLPTSEATIPDQARLLDSIFTIAVAHDAKCQRAENELYRAVGSRGPDQAELSPIDRNTWDELEGNYRLTIVELCATVAAAALRRTAPFGAIADELVARGLIVQLSGHKLEEFLRPIFDESGIGERFEVRPGYQVFKTPGD